MFFLHNRLLFLAREQLSDHGQNAECQFEAPQTSICKAGFSAPRCHQKEAAAPFYFYCGPILLCPRSLFQVLKEEKNTCSIHALCQKASTIPTHQGTSHESSPQKERKLSFVFTHCTFRTQVEPCHLILLGAGSSIWHDFITFVANLL